MKKAYSALGVMVLTMIACSLCYAADEVLTLVYGRVVDVRQYRFREEPQIPIGEHVVYVSFEKYDSGKSYRGGAKLDQQGSRLQSS